MPGTIIDPRMNQAEQNHGIVLIDGTICAYDKLVNNRRDRYLPAGWIVENILPTPINQDEIVYAQYAGQDVRIRVELIWDIAAQGPVIRRIYNYIRNHPYSVFHNVEPMRDQNGNPVPHDQPDDN